MDEVVMLVLERITNVQTVLALDEATDRRCHQQVVCRLMQLDDVDHLDRSCDVETCEMVLLHLPVRRFMSIRVLKRMRMAGYTRRAALFHRALDTCTYLRAPVLELLLELQMEPDAEASVVIPPKFYYEVFQKRCGNLEECFWVLKEAKRKHISLDGFQVCDTMVDILVNYEPARQADIHCAAELFVEAGRVQNLQNAYEILLKALLLSERSETALSALASQWRLLGYDPRSVDVFEAEIRVSSTVSEAIGVFQKMHELDMVAPSGFYLKLLDRCKYFGEAVEFVRELKRQGIKVIGDVFEKLTVPVSAITLLRKLKRREKKEISMGIGLALALRDLFPRWKPFIEYY